MMSAPRPTECMWPPRWLRCRWPGSDRLTTFRSLVNAIVFLPFVGWVHCVCVCVCVRCSHSLTCPRTAAHEYPHSAPTLSYSYECSYAHTRSLTRTDRIVGLTRICCGIVLASAAVIMVCACPPCMRCHSPTRRHTHARTHEMHDNKSDVHVCQCEGRQPKTVWGVTAGHTQTFSGRSIVVVNALVTVGAFDVMCSRLSIASRTTSLASCMRKRSNVHSPPCRPRSGCHNQDQQLKRWWWWLRSDEEWGLHS
jgi:hypothetical protein